MHHRTRSVCALLRADAHTIRKAYRTAMRRAIKTPAQEWLCDNAYLLCRASADVCRALRAAPREIRETCADRAWAQTCAEICDETEVFTQEALLQALCARTPDSLQAQTLPMMLPAQIVHRAACAPDDPQQISRAVRALRSLPDLDFEALLAAVSPLERLLRQDPSGDYAAMDDETRRTYRAVLLRRTHRQHVSVETLAEHVLEKARRAPDARGRHVGAYLLPAYPRLGGALWIAAECLLPFALCIVLALVSRRAVEPLLLLLPLWEAASHLCVPLSLRFVRPRRLPRMELDRVPETMRTLLTVSALLPPAEKADKLGRRLEQLYLSNGEDNVRVCLLADLKTAGTPEKPEDGADMAAGRRMIDRLNERYGGGFLLAVRRRVYAPTEGSYAGWERKRGAITQLVREIDGQTGNFALLCGDTAGLRQTRYLLLLDSDTELPLRAARDMLCAAAHPMNRAVVDRERGRVTAGYGVFAPRVCTGYDSRRTLFQRLFSADGGLSMYESVVSERYQDWFGEGIFAGKGLVDVQAFHAVLDRALPEGLVLSHDILEGGYLRCAYLSDVQASDGFPRDPVSFLARLRRWVRGDWQNLRFIVCRSPLTALSRFKLWDNLRRSLTAPACLFALLCSVFLPLREARITAAVALFACCAEPCFAALRAFLANGFASFSRLYDSGTVPSALCSLLRGAAQLCLLPQQGLASVWSAGQALVRTVRRRRTLEWTTFAETNAASPVRTCRMQCLYAAAVGAVLFISGRALLRLGAIFFWAAIPFLLFSGREKTRQPGRLTAPQREKLTSWAAAMWGYFAENCDFRSNYLPPDNVQETPVYRVAQRTSPTNIGMMLLCTLAARDFGFIDSDELCTRLQQSLGSVEQLETVRGNLLNWYDTQTLQPLEPRYLSAVDCGNFLCCLKALVQGAAEYIPEQPALRQVVERAQALLDKADLKIFYNEKRKLFHIGLDPETGAPSPSYYDLLMSEARMTGYYAIARGIVPKRHWAALSRIMGKAGRYVGPLSWTGTTFEYFMPYLFLPAPEGTLGANALHFCIRCQKRRMRGRPFGISESGFYAFDRDFNYQYKAHGVQQLGLRRGLDAETVLSPYASFLMMQLQPQTLFRNLERLERMQMTGRWGFYEALDLTPRRTCGRPYAVVRSYMAHHVGMSLLAADNVLHDGVLRRRFMRDGEMRAARSLLEEAVPADAPVFKSRAVRETPTPRERIEPHKREIADPDALHPHARVWTNGELSFCAADVGVSQSVYRGVSLFRHSTDILSAPAGVFLALQGEGEAIPFAPMVPQSGASFRCTFLGTEVRYSAAYADLQLRVRVRVHPETAALQYTISVRSNRRRPFTGSVLLYAEPSLTAHREAQSHPAFAKLFLEDRADADNDAYLFRKRERDGGSGVCMAAGLHTPAPHTCTRAKAAALQTGYGLSSLLRGDVTFADMPGGGDACFALQIPVQLPARGTAEHTLWFTAASSEAEALQKLLHVRKEGLRKGAGGLFGDGNMEEVLTERLLPAVVFGARPASCRIAMRQNDLPRQTLWKFGVSGEHPVVLHLLDPAQDVSSVVPYIRAVYRLRHAGFPCDLVIGYREQDVYDSPLFRALQDALREVCGAPERAQGVYPVDLRKFSQEDCAFLQAISVFDVRAQEEMSASVPCLAADDAAPASDSDKLFTFTEGAIEIPKSKRMPYLPWCLVLSNPNFGTLVSDKALGFTWAFNAHEMQLTPWSCDVSLDNRAELLLLRAEDRTVDLLRCASVSFSPEAAQWRGETADIAYSVCVTVPPRALCKRCDVTLRGKKGTRVQLIYAMRPSMGSEARDNAYVHVREHGDGVLLTSPASPVPLTAYLAVRGGADRVWTDDHAFWFADGAAQGAPYAAVARTVELSEDAETNVQFTLSCALRAEAALRMADLPLLPSAPRGAVRVHSADPSFDCMVNTWLPWQIRRCRIEGRTGFYQCGGAWGFRDQIQDVSAFLATDPALVRRHLLRCAAVQFPQGDVLHWWHRLPRGRDGVRGVRTRYRDDLLWLPWLAASYVRATGDEALLDVTIPYLEGEPLAPQETERYFAPTHGTCRETLRQHCMRAVELVLQKGPHGLLLIGGGDWNDGFNAIGLGGRGESVWLSMFMCIVLRDFAPYCDAQTGARYRGEAQTLMQAIESAAWDGDHYLRAFLDDGTPLGKTGDAECAIDSIAQSFAVFASLPQAHASLAVQTAAERLTDKEKGIVRLLAPPFTGKGKQVGYIAAYPPGIRENGGQYTHAAVWLCAAQFLSGRVQAGYDLFRMLNPAFFCRNVERQLLYGGEPYAPAGDIPAADRSIGCTGWNLYTGSAAWMYRTAVEVILGLRVQADAVTFQPHLPRELLPLRLEIVCGSTRIRAEFSRQNGKDLYENGKITDRILLDGGDHSVTVQ